MAISNNDSEDYILPFRLFQGEYRVFVYDVEEAGTQSCGVSYPAVDKSLISGNNSGKILV